MTAACAGPHQRQGEAATGPSDPLGAEAARAYVLELVNGDREEHGVAAVVGDAIATTAAQRHVEDMASHGFTAHWGTDGSVPEQRYSEAGGEHMAQENAFCVIDGATRPLDPDPVFHIEELERVESAFLQQVPPNDSHRRNILKPTHNGLGIGLARPVGGGQPCMVQLFIDAYGEYEPLPRQARLGDIVTVSGVLSDPVEFRGVGVGRLDPARPLSGAQLASLNTPEERTYRIPNPHQTYFASEAGAGEPTTVQLEGRRFSVGVSLNDRGLSGRYQVSVWGRHPGNEDPVVVSLRTIEVPSG